MPTSNRGKAEIAKRSADFREYPDEGKAGSFI
jgi:hypothetical protein